MKSLMFLFALVFGLAIVFSGCKGQSDESTLNEYPSTASSQSSGRIPAECREVGIICGLERTGMVVSAVGALPNNSISCIASITGQGLSIIQNKLTDGSFYSWLGSQGGSKVCAALGCVPAGMLGPFEAVRGACTVGSMLASGVSCGAARKACEDAKFYQQPLVHKACSNPSVTVPGCLRARAFSEGVAYSLSVYRSDKDLGEDCSITYSRSFDKSEVGSCMRQCVENAKKRRDWMCPEADVYKASGRNGILTWTRDQVELLD